MQTILDLACNAKRFISRNDHRNVVVLANDAPLSVAYLCDNCDDWGMEFVDDVLTALSGDDADDQCPSVVALYSVPERLQWACSSTKRLAYIDAIIKSGRELESTVELLTLAMQAEMVDCFDYVRNNLQYRASLFNSRKERLVAA